MVDFEKLETIVDFLENSERNYPDKVCLIFEEKEYTYQEINKSAANIAKILAQKTKKGDVVALLLANTPEFVFSYFGILKSGCVALLISANVADESLIFQIEKTNPKIIISRSNYESKLGRTGVLQKADYLDIEKISSAGDFNLSRKVGGNDISTIIFTSGTTGEPKGLKLRHSNVVNATKNIIEFLKWDENDIDVNASSLTHSFGLGNIHCVFAVGAASVIFRDTINLKNIIKTIGEKKATAFSTVPTVLRLIFNNYLDDFKNFAKSLRLMQTNMSLLEKELINGFLSAVPWIEFDYYYGLAEASRSTFIRLNGHKEKIGSVGQASPNVKIKIVDESGKDLLPGQAGEICIKGKHVIDEYWNNPEASKRIKNGWLHTGDGGYLDKDGFLYFIGRNDDIINVAGEKVSPEEVEETAKKIPGVLDAAAVGMPDKLLGETVKLFISTADQNLDRALIIKECRKNLESFKVPKSVEIISQIPRTENGKLKRRLLKDNK